MLRALSACAGGWWGQVDGALAGAAWPGRSSPPASNSARTTPSQVAARHQLLVGRRKDVRMPESSASVGLNDLRVVLSVLGGGEADGPN